MKKILERQFTGCERVVDGKKIGFTDCLITGFQNSNPFNKGFEDDINALSEAIGFNIERSITYRGPTRRQELKL